MKCKRSLTTEPKYEGYPILTNKEKNYAVDKNILKRIKAQFDYAEASKSKIEYFRCDLHFPRCMDVPKDNEHFKNVAAASMKNFSRHELKPQYSAVREASKNGKRFHYHCVFWLNGQKTKNETNHLETIDRLWCHELGVQVPEDKQGHSGLVNFCNEDPITHKSRINGVLFDPNDAKYKEEKDECFRRASYLAKENTKNTPKGQREYFASRIPKEFKPVKRRKHKDDGDKQ